MEAAMVSSERTRAVVAGVFFIVAAAAAIAGLAFYQGLLQDPNYVVSRSANDDLVFLGGFFEVLVVISVVGTAVTLFPLVKRWNESMAIGYVAGRTFEGMAIAVGIMSLLTIVTLRQHLAGDASVNASSLIALQRALVAVHDWTFLFGPNLALGVNTSLLAYLMFRSGLVPRVIAVIGLVGGPVIFASGTAEMFGLYGQVSTMGALSAVPVFAWEMSLAVWMILKGFKPAAVSPAGSLGIAA